MMPLTIRDDQDPLAPQREAAMFYGLFLRGHSAQRLREEIDVPKSLLQRWLRSPQYEGVFRENAWKQYHYRKRVLAIFDELVTNEKVRARLQ